VFVTQFLHAVFVQWSSWMSENHAAS